MDYMALYSRIQNSLNVYIYVSYFLMITLPLGCWVGTQINKNLIIITISIVVTEMI
jgi:hypothetical protein